MRISVQIEFDKILDLETKKSSVVLGRSHDCDLIIPHHAISRQHCRVEIHEKNFYITDLGSSNGVYINGQRLQPHQKVPYFPDSMLALGTLECEISMVSKKEKSENIVSKKSAGEVTATIRVARIDIDREVITTRKLTSEAPRVKGPRNPVTEIAEKEPTIINKKLILIIALLIGISAYVAWVFLFNV